jgi:hypothetical protein
MRRRKTHFFDFLTLENGTNKFSQNVSMELPLYAAQNSRLQISFTSRRKPEITQNLFGFNDWGVCQIVVDCQNISERVVYMCVCVCVCVRACVRARACTLLVLPNEVKPYTLLICQVPMTCSKDE